MKALFKPRASPLQLDRYFLKSLHFELKPGFDKGRIPIGEFALPNLEIGVLSAEQHPNDPMQWRFEVKLELPDSADSKFPYTVETILVGEFTVADERWTVEQAERLALVNGPALLYSSAREIVASITGRSPYPKLLIPSVTFFQPETDQPKIVERRPKQLGTARRKANGVKRK